MSDKESRVRERAYQLWEAAGRPDHRGDEFWHLASAEPDGQAHEEHHSNAPEMTVDTGMPFETSGQDEAEVTPHEAGAAEATVPHEPQGAAQAARAASAVTETVGTQEPRRSRGGRGGGR